MRLKDHIAYHFLTDGAVTEEIMKVTCREELDLTKDVDLTKYRVLGHDNKYKRAETKIGMYYQLCCPPLAAAHIPHQSYYITDTVTKKLDLIKVSAKNGDYDWTIFKNIPEGKKTFIFTKDSLLRFFVFDDVIMFLYLTDKKTPKVSVVWVDRKTNDKHEAFNNQLKTSLDELTLYRLLCFFYFSKNEEIIVKPGEKHGTRKQPDSIYNESDLDVIIVNNNWNITSIRNEGFDVSGHFRLQPCGVGLNDVRLIFIQPFKKKGYIRKAKNQETL